MSKETLCEIKPLLEFAHLRPKMSHFLPHIFEALSGGSLALVALLAAAAVFFAKPRSPLARKSVFSAVWFPLGLPLYLLLP